MRQYNKRVTGAILAAAVAAIRTSSAHAAITVDGMLDPGYGSALAIQTNNTQFGKADGNGGAGSELDAAYGVIQNGALDLFFAGDVEQNFNHLNLFIADGRSGQSVLNAQGALTQMNGSKFSPGFSATYALDINGGGTPQTTYINVNDLTQPSGPSNYIGSFLTGNGAANTVGPLTVSFNNTNTAGINSSAPSMASATAAAAVTTGIEISIPLAQLGSPRGAIEVLADINAAGGNNTPPNAYLSNQFLPGLPTIQGNVGNNGVFDFSSTPGQYFTVPAAVVTSSSINGVYNSSGGGSYNNSAHWLNGKVPNNPADTATFGSSITAPSTITLDGNRTLGQVTFNNTNAYTIAPGTPTTSTLTIDDTGDVTGVNPFISVVAGSHVISAPVALANGVTFSTASGTSLTISGVLSGAGSFTKNGPGNLILSGNNTFTATAANILNGTLELDNAGAGSAAQIFIGDPSADNVPAALNVGVAGVTIPNSIVTYQDDAGNNNTRTVSTTAASATFTGALYLDGGVVFAAPAGGTLTYAGTIADGQNSINTAKHDVTVNGPGAVVLSGADTYSGNTVVNAGATLTVAGTLSSTTNLTSNGSTTIAANPGTGFATRTVGSVTIGQGGTVALASPASNANRTLLVTGSLSISNDSTGAFNGQLDLGKNDMDVTGGNLAAVTAAVAQGFNFTGGANFRGQGVTSSAAASDSRHLTAVGVISNSANGTQIYGPSKTFDGYSPAATDILVKYTDFGDANLDGVVDGSDYSLIDNGFAADKTTPGSATGWYNGDFNYDGVVDGSDYTLIDNAFNNQNRSAFPSAIAAPLAAQSTGQVAGVAAVPEPASLALLPVAAVAITARRRRMNPRH